MYPFSFINILDIVVKVICISLKYTFTSGLVLIKGEKEVNLSECRDIYLKKCNAKNLSIQTLHNYEYCLKTFFDFCDKRNIVSVNQINQFIIIDFMNSINGKYSSITVKDKFIVLKAFFNCLTDIGIIDCNPMERMSRPKVTKKIIYSFSKNDIKDIMSSFDKTDFIGYRNYTIMNVLFGTGIRKSELVNIQLNDFDWGDNSLKIYGKGSKERIIPIGYNLQRIILSYNRKRKEYLAEHKYDNSIKLFINRYGRPLSKGGVSAIFMTLKNSKKSWSTRVSAHTFRHTFAKMFLLNGGDLFSLQRILGHEDISITRLYVDLNISELKIQNEKYNPLDNTRWQYY